MTDSPRADTASKLLAVAGLLAVAISALTGYALVALGDGTLGELGLGALAFAVALGELAACWMLYTGREHAHDAAIIAFAVGMALAFVGWNVVGVAVCGLLAVLVYWRRD
ncbi:hypothetical protein GCM10009037_12330 [Halarchaeum grantii]|uniref:Uncharacterized protein n=1 Tax=Halarchaeum grantii TaxID=1193105 RepID=A0A830F8J0_9EURY|nr:hypothetical protein [Halarchaeum grantii]GGL30191.1 hypothetical protein GCM10009037_12330 [Halarchaeum grantii]